MATWNLDTAHTSADFAVRHMMVTTVRGTLGAVSGTLQFDPESLKLSSVDATIDVSGLNTGVADRDAHLRSEDFFAVETYPNITFKSTNVEILSDTSAKVTGDLTIKDVTKSVTLKVDYLGSGGSPFGDTRAGFEATTTINREDFGLTWNVALEQGGVLVGKDVKVSLDVQAILVTEEETA